ncbi:hypothetical protein [Celeribacter sp. ULVN23_4]
MAFLDAFRPVAAMSELLDKEKAAILKNDFSALESLLKSKETLLPLFAKTTASPEVLQDLQKRAEHNKRLLSASAKGVRMARERLLALRKSSQGFTAYGPAGTSTEIERKPLTMKRKA